MKCGGFGFAFLFPELNASDLTLQVSDHGVEMIAWHLTSLRSLDLSDCSSGITDTGLEAIASRLSLLTRLELCHLCRISDRGVNALSGLTLLQQLHLRECADITDEGFGCLARSLSMLTRLELGQCEITDVGVCASAEGLSALKHFDLSFCRNLSDVGVESLVLLRNLSTLGLVHCQITDSSVRGLTALEHLTDLDISGTAVTQEVVDSFPDCCVVMAKDFVGGTSLD